MIPLLKLDPASAKRIYERWRKDRQVLKPYQMKRGEKGIPVLYKRSVEPNTRYYPQ